MGGKGQRERYRLADCKAYCLNYRGGGYTDWRMPAQDELAGLYDKTKTYKAGCGYDVHLTELIHLTCYRVYASETRFDDAACFVFGDGDRTWERQIYTGSHFVFRALPVRSAK